MNLLETSFPLRLMQLPTETLFRGMKERADSSMKDTNILQASISRSNFALNTLLHTGHSALTILAPGSSENT
jgi:hypothetical protein